MKLIVPNSLELLTCSLAESDSADGALWNASTTYAKGDRVRHEHVKYESLDSSNKGNDPAKTWSGIDAKWKKIEATGPWKMLDDFVETQTVSAAGQTLAFTVPFKYADSFALLNVEGTTARVTLTDLDADPNILRDITDFSLRQYNYEPLLGSDILHLREYSLLEDISKFSLFAYNYSPMRGMGNLVVTGLPTPANAVLKIEIETTESSGAALGHLVVGKGAQIGLSKYGAEIGMTDYSRKETDEFGVTRLVRRSFASTTSLPVYLHPNQLDHVARTLQNARGTPCLWIGDNYDNGHQSLTVYGWLEDFRLVCEGPNEIDLSLEIQGLI